MSLRALGSLLSRRFSSRRFPRAHAQPAQAEFLLGIVTRRGSAAGRPARSLHTLRDLAAGDGAYGAVAASVLVGIAGILYLAKEAPTESEITGEDARKEVASQVTVRQAIEVEGGDDMEVDAKESHKDDGSNFSLEAYLAEMTEMAAAQKEARYEREVARRDAVHCKTLKLEDDMEEEAAMKARFEEWIEEYGRKYKDQEEKAWRYELFKNFAKMVDKATAEAKGGAVFITNHTADWTEEECKCLYDTDVDWDDYLDHIRSLIAEKNAKAGKKRGHGQSNHQAGTYPKSSAKLTLTQ